MEKKTCIKCGDEKTIDQFPLTSYKKQDGTRATRTECKTCFNRKRDERRKRNGISDTRRKAQSDKSTKYYQTREEKRRDRDLKSKYGIGLNEYNHMLVQQNYGCKICGLSHTETRTGVLDVDHCHTTGLVRGLLCTDCNNGLGRFKDNTEILRRAINYLEKTL
jgi:hypothetical protein